MGGVNITRGMFKADPHRVKGCPFERNCGIGNKGSCTQQKAVYELKCKICMERKEQEEARGGGRG